MKRVLKLLEQVSLEFETAEDYIHCANETDGNIRDYYKKLAKEELEHAEILLEIGDDSKFENESKEKIIWEFEKERIKAKHSKLVSQLAQVK